MKNEDFIKQVGANLKKIRKDNKISAEVLASHIGLSRTSYYYLETGQVEMSVSRLKQLAEGLAVPMGSILGEKTEITEMLSALRDEIAYYAQQKNETE